MAYQSKVRKVSTVIRKVCRIQGLKVTEELLLTEWGRIALEHEKYDDDENVSFILAKYAFIEYIRSIYQKWVLTDFIINTLQTIRF